MDPLQILPTALSLPADSAEQVALLSQLAEQLEQQPAPIANLVPPLLGGVVSSKDSAFKRWTIDLLQFGLTRSTFPLEIKAQLALQCLDNLFALLSDPSHTILKNTIQCFASAYPLVFRSACVNRNNRGPWDVLTQAKRRILGMIDNPNVPVGAVLAAVKFMQRTIITQSRGISDPRLQNKADPNLNMLSPDHPFMNVRELESEGGSLLQQMLGILNKSTNPEILCAVLNCFISLIKQRPAMLQSIVMTLTSWNPVLVVGSLSPTELKSVEKTLRIVLVHISRHGYAAQFQQEIMEALSLQQARMDQAAREGRKRAMTDPPDEQAHAKRPKTNGEAPAAQSGLNLLAAFDFTTLPQALVTDLVVANLVAVSRARLDAAVETYRNGCGSPPGVAPAPTAPASVEPVAAPSTDEPLDPLKMELDEDEIDFEADKINANLALDEPPDAPEGEDDDMMMQLAQTAFELPPARPLSLEERTALLNSSLDRIRAKGEAIGPLTAAIADSSSADQPPRPIHGLPGNEAWMLFVVRMATRGLQQVRQSVQNGQLSEVIPQGSSHPMAVRQMLYDYVMEDFSKRHRFATIWLNEEWHNDTVRRETEPEWEPQYDPWLEKIVTEQISRADMRDKILPAFLLDLPVLPDSVFSRLRELSIGNKMAIGINSLRDIVSLRPPMRSKAMEILLDLTTHDNKGLRAAAIITVRKWVPEQQPMDGMVRAYATGALRRLVVNPLQLAWLRKKPVEKDKDVEMNGEEAAEREEDDPAEESPRQSTFLEVKPSDSPYLPQEIVAPAKESEVLQFCELYFGLAVKVNELIPTIFEAYCMMEPSVQEMVEYHITPLVKTLGPSNTTLVEIMRTFPPEAEKLALKLIRIWTSTGRAQAAVVSLVKDICSERDLSPKFIMCVLSELDKTEIVKYLPKIVSTLSGHAEDRKSVEKVFYEIVERAPVGTSTNLPRDRQTDRLTPAELMVLLHDQEKEIGLKPAIEAISICFAMTDVFNSETLAVVMQQIVDEPVLPLLFMRTVIQAVTTYKTLVGFVTTTLFSRLIVKKIWTNVPLWEGFIRCAKITAPASFNALLQLQKDQLRELVDKQPGLKSGLREYVVKKERSKSKLAGLLETLGDDEATPLQETPAPTPPPPQAIAAAPN